MKPFQLEAATLIQYIANRLLDEAIADGNPKAIRKARQYQERSLAKLSRLQKKAV